MKTRRNIFSGLLMVAASLFCLMGCKKDDEGEKVVLNVEFEQTAGMQKTYIGSNDRTIYWNAGDEVNINGTACEVHEGAVEVLLSDDGYASVYPKTGTLNASGKNCTGGSVEIPAVQTYTLVNGKQQLNAPMAARLDSKSGHLQYRNLYSVIRVTVRAKTDKNFELYNIRITANGNLAGTVPFTFNGSTDTAAPTVEAPTTGGVNSVMLTGMDSLIKAGDSAIFYLYTLPISGETLTIMLNGNRYQEKSKPDGISIGRSVMGRTTVNVADLTLTEYVDLGLSVLWATRNVDAEQPEDRGNYFAWGKTETYYSSINPVTWKTNYLEGYAQKTYCGNNGIFKELNPIPYNTDNNILLSTYDAATANCIESMNWHGNWRTPDTTEFRALIDRNNCNWKHVNEGDVAGWTVISKVPGYEGNSIFLPATGVYIETALDSLIGDFGYYWSSRRGGKSSGAYAMRLYPLSNDIYSFDRWDGMPIRPVKPKN